MHTIFIQIPAYRDVELVPTLTDLFQNAAYPSQLRVCVCWQHADGDKFPKEFRHHPNVELIEVNNLQSNGCNWARRKMQQLWKGEQYTLLLDSHHRFIQHWDTHLIRMYESLRQSGIKKPLLTAYLPSYVPHTDPVGRGGEPLQMHVHSRERGMLIYLEAHTIPSWQRLAMPVKAKFASLHFIFTEGSFNETITFDDDIYFFGDEVFVSLKAFTYGYDLYHPHYVIGWHLYNRDNTRIPHWNDHTDVQKRNEVSHTKLRNIFLGVEEEAYGNERTLQDYEQHIADKLIISQS